MATGPINCLGEVSRVMRPHSVWKISSRELHVLLNAHADGFDRRRA